MWNMIINFLSRRRTMNELSRLSDRELADIGLQRDQIRILARSISRT